MFDPIGGFNRIKDFFVSYLDTAFRISDEATSEARRNLLLSPDILATDPFIEPVLRYRSSELSIEQIVDDNETLGPICPEGRVAFAELALSGLFDGIEVQGRLRRKSTYNPYLHQVEMLRRGVRNGQPGIVTSGTGSGKTESFMLPVFAQIANEAVRWPAPQPDYLQNRWWTGNATYRPRRAGEHPNRNPALRALILYPMNALVDDQMVRLRKALDSDAARSVMDERFSGNRIFFGQYTSSTPVTGYARHPRRYADPAEKKRRARHGAELRRAMRKFDVDQNASRRHDLEQARIAAERGDPTPDPTRFIFPATDGGELVSRWDMQAAPPDILVTNASMLGAMLSREVEDDMFEKTRRWLEVDPEAYFFLIFDELHLIRGSAGTEVGFLMKSLLERLGLDHPDRIHKLRILASSASLPLGGERGLQSLKYLRDLFAPYGTSSGPGDRGTTDPEFWRDCVIEGLPSIPEWGGRRLPAAPFHEILDAADAAGGVFVAEVEPTARLQEAIKGVGRAFQLDETQSNLVGRIAEKASETIVGVCRSESGARATAVRKISEQAFRPGEGDERSVRGLLLARSLPECPGLSASVSRGTPSFRFHSFIRNVEGLFGAPVSSDGEVRFVDLTIERGTSHGPPAPGATRGRRLFEMLYCEACGELLLGGQTGSRARGPRVEMLPSAADLESVPEKGSSEYYDKMLFDEFAVFWPRRDAPETSERNYDRWDQASLDTETGLVTVGSNGPEGHLSGYLYFQTEDAIRDAKGNIIGRKTAQPFCCPKCGTDYSFRPRSNRSRSPIRAFRTGVSKASQMVATEMFELLHAAKAEPKSIVFSDSRLDAANQALEIERLHLRDLRREILVSVARNYMTEMERTYVPPERTNEAIQEILARTDIPYDQRMAEVARLAASGADESIDVPARKVRLDRLLQFSGDSDTVSQVTSEFVRLGIHPYDEVGRRTFKGRPWWEAFSKRGDEIRFENLTHLDAAELSNQILRSQYELVDDVVFSNTFFALEETGLAYPSLGRGLDRDIDEHDAWLRVFAGAYRVEDNKYFDENTARQWESGGEIPARNRVRRFADALFGVQAEVSLTDILGVLRDRYGHPGGKIKVGRLYLRIAREGDPYWRCDSCERVHLHLGVGRCTRCHDPLPAEPSGTVEELWQSNFLGRRIVRSHDEGTPRFRLRCEELTGQTEDFSDRLRRFKEIFIDQPSEIARLASEIDMLSVTTTMEVGIDIGTLQSIFQANMPPQRFNYQQRVGRAGRRDQAFSFVVTFCRGRSHDAYYYRHPEAITGDPPPAPFLAVEHNPIPLRLLRKVWLRTAFALMRDQCVGRGEPYPGDALVPPDVHGEFVSTADFYDQGSVWPDRLLDALRQTAEARDKFISASIWNDDQAQEIRAASDPDSLHREITDLAPFAPRSPTGLAEFLAERGLLPMYGMPTRVRNLYLGLVKESNERNGEYRWSAIDRDLDMAIYEFAPGAVLVKDKQKHRVIGFTGGLVAPERRGNVTRISDPLSNWYGDEAFVAKCVACGAAKQEPNLPVVEVACDDCHQPILPDDFRRYLSPSAFRTDFRAEDNDLDESGRMTIRTVATVLREGQPIESGSLRIHRGAGTTVMNLNDGVEDDQGDPSFFTVNLTQDTQVSKTVRTNWLEEQAIAAEFAQQAPQRFRQQQAGIGPFGMISRKETEAVYIEAMRFDPRLALDLVAKRGEMSQVSVRAAALSTTHLLVQKAALELDVAPDEFEALEPRIRHGRPVLQIADALINGSGLCRRLAEQRSDGKPEIVYLAEEILTNTSSWPLRDFLTDAHQNTCATSCYRCIQQFQNRRFHSLLDWRLGLAYMRAMLNPEFTCGLDGDFDSYPELAGWMKHARGLANSVAAMRPRSLRVSSAEHQNLPTIMHLDQQGRAIRRTIVAHPLWRLDANVVQRFGLGFAGLTTSFVDTFDLERRPLRALEIAGEREPAPEFQAA